MANQVVELYEALLQSIAALDDTPCGLEGLAAAARQQQEQCHAFKQLLKEFKQAGISQQSNWKKLISDHEVLKSLAELCNSEHSQLGLKHFAAVTSFITVLVQSSQQDWYPWSAVSRNRPPSTIANILAEQLQQCGFLQQLPGLLSTAADQLTAVQDEQEMLASMQLPNPIHDIWVALDTPLVALQQRYATELLLLLVPVGVLPPVLPAAAVGAAQRLIHAAVQHSCRCLELLPDQTVPQQSTGLPDAAYSAITTLYYLTSTAWCCSTNDTTSSSSSSSSSSIATLSSVVNQQPRQFLEKLRASSILLLLAFCQQQSRRLHRQLKQGCIDSLERSSSIWQYACTQHSQLPQPYLQLCQALGFSGRAFLHTACSSNVRFSKGCLMDLSCSLIRGIQAEARQQQQQQQQQPVQGLAQRASAFEQQQQQQQDDFTALALVPGLAAIAVLHWATNQSMNDFAIVSAAVRLARNLLQVIVIPSRAELHSQQTAVASHTQPLQQQQVLQDPQCQQQQRQQQQQVLQAPLHHSSQCDSEESLSEGCQQDTMQRWLTGQLLEQTLELSSTLIQKFWVLLTAGEAAAVAVGAAADNSSSSSTISSSSSSTPLFSKAHRNMLWDLKDLVTQLKLQAEAFHGAQLLAGTSSGPQDTQQPTSSSKAWVKHMPLLLRPFEVLIRTLAHQQETHSCIVHMFCSPLETFVGPDALMVSYWCSGASRDLDPQLISTCFSILKALAVCRCVDADDQAAMRSKAAMQVCYVSHEAVCASSDSRTVCGGSPTDEAPPHACSSSSSSNDGSSSEVVSVLPWLVLLGRCCLHWALELQQPGAACWAEPESRSSLVVCFEAVQEVCLGCLQDDSTAADLAAAGYDTRRVVAALQALTLPAGPEGHSATASDDSEPAAIYVADVAALTQQLHALGQALNTLAISCACNNPYCSNLEGLSELDLVQGRARLCAKCRTARYCSKECKAQHWKLHKPACKALAAVQQA